MKFKAGDRVKVITGSYKGVIDTISEIFGDRVRLSNTNVRTVKVKSIFKKKVSKNLGISIHKSNVVPVTEDDQVSRKVKLVRKGKNVQRMLIDGSKMLGDSYYLVSYLRSKNARRERLSKR